jgi:hypothetical protein
MENNQDIDICGGKLQYFGDKDKVSNVEVKDKDIKVHLLTGNPFCHSTVVIRKSFLDNNKLTYKNVDCQNALKRRFTFLYRKALMKNSKLNIIKVLMFKY